MCNFFLKGPVLQARENKLKFCADSRKFCVVTLVCVCALLKLCVMLEHWACRQVGSVFAMIPKTSTFFPAYFYLENCPMNVFFILKSVPIHWMQHFFLQPACSPNSATNMNHPTAHAQAPHSVWAYKDSLCLGLYLYFTLLHNTKALLCWRLEASVISPHYFGMKLPGWRTY